MHNSIQQFILSLPLVCACQKPSARIAQRTLSAASRKVTASGSNIINRSPVTAKGLCKQTGACAWLVASALLDSGTFFTYSISRVWEKNRTGRVKTEEEVLSPHQEAHWYPRVRMYICSGTGGSEPCREERRGTLDSTGTGQNMLKDAIDMRAEHIHKSCRKKPNAGNDRLKVFLSEFHHNSTT